MKASFLQLTFFLLLSTTIFAQNIQDPTSWTYEVKKISGNDYELIFHLTLKDGWHVWSLHPGGDGTLIQPSFMFMLDPSFSMLSEIKEVGKAETTKMEGIKGKVTYLGGNVDYVQKIRVKGPMRLTGKHSYQVCNDMMCLPPASKDFSFQIK